MYTGRRGVSPHARVARPPRCASTSSSNFELGGLLRRPPWPLRACRIAPIEVRLQLVCRIAPIGSSPIGLPHRPDWFETPIVIAYAYALSTTPDWSAGRPPIQLPQTARDVPRFVSVKSRRRDSRRKLAFRNWYTIRQVSAHVPMVGERRE